MNVKLNGNLTWNLFSLNDTTTDTTTLDSNTKLNLNDIILNSSTPLQINPLLAYGSGYYGASYYGFDLSVVNTNSIFIDNNRILSTYMNATIAFLVIRTYNSSTGLWEITTSTSMNDKINVDEKIQLLKYDNDKILIAYRYMNNCKGKITLISTKDDVLTELNSFIFENNTISNIAMCLSDDDIIMSYVDMDSESFSGKLKILSLSNNIISEIEDSYTYYEEGDSNITYVQLFNINNKRSILSYIDQDGLHVTRVVEQNGTTLSIATKQFSGGGSSLTLMTQLDTSKFIIGFTETTFKLAEIDVYDNQIIMNTEYDTGLNIDSFTLSKSYSNLTDIYWFTCIYSDATDTVSQNFIVEQGRIYVGNNDSVVESHDNQNLLINESNIGCYEYADNSDGYGYIRTISGLDTLSGQIARMATWETDITKILGYFNNTLEAGNITGDISSWILRRKEDGTSLYETIDTFESSETEYTDNKVKNNTEYIYLLSTLDVNGNRSNSIANTGEVSFSGWIISDENETYNLDIGWDGYETSDIPTNKGVYQYNSISQFPTLSYGQQNYRSGQIKCIPYKYNSDITDYDIDLDTLEDFKTFINNENKKWLRTQDSDMMIISTKGLSYKYKDKIKEQPMEVSFEWVEVEDI